MFYVKKVKPTMFPFDDNRQKIFAIVINRVMSSMDIAISTIRMKERFNGRIYSNPVR
jgi:hypothetical protein